MSKLYKNRYLIAVYDKTDENLLGVFEKPNEMKDLIGKSVGCVVSRALRYVSRPRVAKNYKYSIHFIDVFEKQDDCFADEDVIFLNQFGYSQTTDNSNIENEDADEWQM